VVALYLYEKSGLYHERKVFYTGLINVCEMAALELIPIAKIVIGLVLIFVAARIVGFVIKVTGVLFIGYGAYQYVLVRYVTLEAVFPAIVGIALIAVGKSMAETAIKIIGVLVVLWGVVGLGII
jgi:hypothetical protein